MTQWQPGIDYATSPLDELAIANGCYFDQEAAEKFEQRCRKYLRVVDGNYAGQPLELLPFQRFHICRPLFGWKKANGKRRFESGYISMAKKNGKSFLMDAIALDGLLWDGEPSPLVCLAAYSREQAGEMFRDIKTMAEQSPAIRGHVRVVDSRGRIYYRGINNSVNGELRSMSKESKGAHGWKISRLLFDELHVQENRKLWDTVRYAGRSRKQPLLLAITTAGWDRTTICWEQCVYARGVLSGEIKDISFFACIFEADEKDDWTDPEVWKKANPGLGTILTMEDMEKDFAEAKTMPAKENTFRQLRLNQWTQQAKRWLPMRDWNLCDGPLEIEANETCWAGLDLATTNDTAAFVRVYPREDGKFEIRPHFWVSEFHAIERETNNRQKFNEWIASGLVTVCHGAAINMEQIAEYIIECSQEGDLREVAFDQRYAAQIEQACTSQGVTMVQFAQTMTTMGPVATTLLPRVVNHELVHAGNPVLSWMAGNVAIYSDGNAAMMSKKSSPEKIDGMIALGMALQRCVLQQGEPKADFYEHNAVEIW